MRRHPGADRAAVDGVTLEVAAGELVTVVGPSGSGKSTLLRLAAGLDRPDAGRVRVGDRDVTEVAPADRGVAMVFQSYALFPHLDVEANIGFGLHARGVDGAQRRAAVGDAAERLGLTALLRRRPAQLSGGERQRVALARGLVGRPQVLLLDEPFSGLDAQLRSRARAEVRRLQRESALTMVLVTHDQAEALSLGDRVAVLDDGRLLQAGSPEEVYDRPQTTAVARFVGAPPMNLLPAEGGVVRGFRPEGVEVGDGPGALRGVVELIERAGHEVVWHVRHEGVLLAVRPPSGTAPVREGDAVALRILPGAERRFDAVTGEALA